MLSINPTQHCSTPNEFSQRFLRPTAQLLPTPTRVCANYKVLRKVHSVCRDFLTAVLCRWICQHLVSFANNAIVISSEHVMFQHEVPFAPFWISLESLVSKSLNAYPSGHSLSTRIAELSLVAQRPKKTRR